MKILLTDYFSGQLNELKRTYRLIWQDFESFQKDISTHISADLGAGRYKCRYKNSSIPCGKSGGLRFIIFVSGDVCIPLLVYAKSKKANTSSEEIIIALERCVQELERT